MEESVFMDGVRSFFAMLDRMVYSLIAIFYNTISDLASAQIVNSTVITTITSRIYALLSVFMIFKISFSLISYIVDPNKISDKAKGGGSLIKHIVITFALIVSVPFAFNMLYEAQSALLADQLIPRFLLGTEINETPNGDGDVGSGYKMQMTDCDNVLEIPNMGNFIGLALFKPFFVPQKEVIGADGSITNKVGEFTENAHNLYCTAGEYLGEASVKHLLSDDDLYNSPKGWTTDNYYTIDYSFALSTAIGVVVALILLGYCFDVATRAFKLLFLEIIAPIPIISYIDPDSAKSGMFIKWLKEVGGTWISLFTRLASLFLAIFVIQQVTSVDGQLYFVAGYEFNGNKAWIKILLIIGALMFAKQLPKILENILGFQLGGNMTLNPMKKVEGEMVGGKQAIGAGKAVTAGALGAVGGGLAGFVAGSHAGSPVRGTVRGVLSGISTGQGAGVHALGKSMSQTYKNLTGNEMANLSPSRFIAGIGGARKVNEIKGHLSNARDRRTDAETRLNSAMYRSSRASNALKNTGIDLNNTTGARSSAVNAMNSINLSALESSRDKAQRELEAAQASHSRLQSQLNSSIELPASVKADLNKQIKASESHIQSLQATYDQALGECNSGRSDYDRYSNIIDSIDAYNSAIEEEEALRKEIASIEKDINILSDEKKQRETYYQKDSSGKADVKGAMKRN